MKISSVALFRVSILLAAKTGSRTAVAFSARQTVVTHRIHNPSSFSTTCAAFSSTCRLSQQSQTRTHATRGDDDNNWETTTSTTTTSTDFAMDPRTEQARQLTLSRLGLNEKQHQQLAELASLVVEWNESINLISRKDCTESVVFGRHILPSLAVGGVGDSGQPGLFRSGNRVIDVGTGGGFPGLPLAIAFPDTDFLLVDSVGKKLKAVKAMVEDIGLDNVKTHHGRVEEMVDDVLEGSRHRGAYDVCVGRSVAALPKFCFWIRDLLKKETKSDGGVEGGQLLYIIGGEIEDSILSRVKSNDEIENLLDTNGASDKRVLVFSQDAVSTLATESGLSKVRRGSNPKKNNNNSRSRQTAKGAWAKKDNSQKKQRGYDDFKRTEIN